MDRHICKAKRTDNGEWVYGVYYKQTHFYGDESERYYIITSTEALDYDQALEYFEVDPNTICQCTGVPDKNGRILFEHDIVKMRSYGKGYYETEVYFKNGKFSVDGSNCCFKHICSNYCHFKDICSNSVEFVRNKFDNPELLEVQL